MARYTTAIRITIPSVIKERAERADPESDLVAVGVVKGKVLEPPLVPLPVKVDESLEDDSRLVMVPGTRVLSPLAELELVRVIYGTLCPMALQLATSARTSF